MSPRRQKKSTGSNIPLGALFLLVAVVASVMLAVHQLGGGLPGCGENSACDSLARSVWGKVPGIGWPTSYVGLAYFVGMLVAWFASGGRLNGLLRPIALVGGLVSVVLIGVMLAQSKVCAYCLAAHAGNLLFLAVALRGGGGEAAPRGVMAFGALFVAATAVLAGLDYNNRSQRDAEAEEARAEATRQMTEQAQNSNDDNGASLSAGLESDERWGEDGFRGRYVHGPDEAPIRVVMLTDYQCPDCKRIEGDLRRMMDTRDDLQVTIKHFPMCREAGGGEICNKYVSRTLHSNACWAARAAEAAGQVGGDEAFFDMHFWLFEKEGKFQRPELTNQVNSMGLDVDAFYAAMESGQTLDIIRGDVDDGFALGLHFTPLVFVNGVELKGWNAPNAIGKTIEEVAAANPPARKVGSDRPPFAEGKYVNDWKQSPRRRMPADNQPRFFGEAGSSQAPGYIQVTVWGDYQEENTARVDRHIRDYMSQHENVEYNFRHYPVDPGCNGTLPPNVPASSVHPKACWAAKAAEAAMEVGGEEAFFKAHAWLIDNWSSLNSAGIGDVAKAADVDEGKLQQAMESETTRSAIDEDAKAAEQLGVRSIPLVFVERKQLPRTRREGANVMEWILDAAREPK